MVQQITVANRIRFLTHDDIGSDEIDIHGIKRLFIDKDYRDSNPDMPEAYADNAQDGQTD